MGRGRPPSGPHRELPAFRLEDIAPREETCLAAARAAISAFEYIEERGIRLLIRDDACIDGLDGARSLAVYARLREIVRRHPPPMGVRMRADMVLARLGSRGDKELSVDRLDLSSDAPSVDDDAFDWGGADERTARRAASEGVVVFAIVGDGPWEISICIGSCEDAGVIIDYPRFFAELHRGAWMSAPNRGSMTDEFLLERAKSIMAAARVMELAMEIAEDEASAIPDEPFGCMDYIRGDCMRYDSRDARAAFFDARILKTLFVEYSLARYREKLGFVE